MSTGVTPTDPAGRLPGPRGRDAVALIPRVRRDPLALLTSLHQRYGDRIVVPMFGRYEAFVLSNPDDVSRVLVSNQDSYVKAPTYRPMTELLGNGLLTNEGENWARQRKLVQPMFAKRQLARFAPHMVAATEAMLDRWATMPDGTVVDTAREMSALTLDVVGRALFGTDLTGEAAGLAPALSVALDSYVRLVSHPLYWLVPGYQSWRTPNRRRAERAEQHLRTVVRRIVLRRTTTRDRKRPKDLLDMLLSAKDPESSGPMSATQVNDELMTFLLAGHETTANALSWTLLLLSTHPEARGVLESEVDEVLAGRPPTVDNPDDVDKLAWTTAVISESMRLYPPAWSLERQAAADDDLDGMRIPRGSMVITPPYLVHRHPDHWPNPEGFDPERFLPALATGRHRFAYLPFGGGRRQCIGSGFAMLETTLLLAQISQRYRLDLVPGATPVARPSVTLRPSNGIPMTLHARQRN